MKIFSIAAFGALVLAQGASAGIITFDAILSGPNEAPPNASPGIGFAALDFDTVANTLRVQVIFSGLLGTTSASHIHCCTTTPGTGTAMVATELPSFVGFPLGVTSGTYDQTFNMLLDSFYNPAFESANGGTSASAEAALLAGLGAGKAYLNIHTTVVPGGEIRGFSTAVPEPTTFLMGGAALAGLAILRRKRAA